MTGESELEQCPPALDPGKALGKAGFRSSKSSWWQSGSDCPMRQSDQTGDALALDNARQLAASIDGDF